MPGFELIGQEELDQITEIFDKSKILFRHSFDNLRNGVYKVRDFEDTFAQRMNVPHALAVTSGTAALRVALASLNLDEGDEVITQSFTFVATVEAIIESRAIPVIAEIDDTLNMDPADLEAKITDKTKAIIVVHMLGNPARLDRIAEIAHQKNIPLIEDTAWGCGGTYNNQPLGTHGAIGCFSFDFAKTMTTGEGGMVVFQQKERYDRAAAWHDHGHENNPEFPRWEDTRSGSGFNYRMTELQGAVGLAQLKKLDTVIEAQRNNRRAIQDAIADLPGITFRTVIDGANGTDDALVFYVKSNAIARQCRQSLLDQGLGTKILPEAVTWHYAATWDHMPSLVQRHGPTLSSAFPQSTSWLDRAVALPIVVNMDDVVPQKMRAALQTVLV